MRSREMSRKYGGVVIPLNESRFGVRVPITLVTVVEGDYSTATVARTFFRCKFDGHVVEHASYEEVKRQAVAKANGLKDRQWFRYLIPHTRRAELYGKPMRGYDPVLASECMVDAFEPPIPGKGTSGTRVRSQDPKNGRRYVPETHGADVEGGEYLPDTPLNRSRLDRIYRDVRDAISAAERQIKRLIAQERGRPAPEFKERG